MCIRDSFYFIVFFLSTSSTAFGQLDFFQRIREAVQNTISGTTTKEDSSDKDDAAVTASDDIPQNKSEYVHSAPVILRAGDHPRFAGYSIKSYRLFKTDKKGKATVIPFQIDELNRRKDYIVDEGGWTNKQTGNRIFDLHDELCFMGDDIGFDTAPKVWPEGKKPTLVYKLLFEPPSVMAKYSRKGAVYVGIYVNKTPPKLSDKYYVQYDPANSTCLLYTSPSPRDATLSRMPSSA